MTHPNLQTNHKKFIDHVIHNNVDKVNKLCSKGLDPNFHCLDNDGGEILPPFLKKYEVIAKKRAVSE